MGRAGASRSGGFIEEKGGVERLISVSKSDSDSPGDSF